MSRADERVARDVVLRWDGVAWPIARRHGIGRALLLALVCQESAGDPAARREEPGFLRAYGDGIVRSINRVPNAQDRRRYLEWYARQPIALATSYGLCQVLNIVAIEFGVRLAEVTSQTDPATSLEAGCAKLRSCLQATHGQIGPALLRYNGGGAPQYDDEVLAWRALIAKALG